MGENIENKGNPTEKGEEKKFTQAEVDAIIAKRLAEEKKKSESNPLAEKEAELNRRELKIKAKEALADSHLPVELAEALRYDTEEDLKAAVGSLKAAFESKAAESMAGLKVYDPKSAKLPPFKEVPEADKPLKDAFGLK